MSKPFSRRTHRYRNGLVGTTGVAIAVLIVGTLLVIALRFFAPGVLSMVTTPLWRTGTYLSHAVRGNTTIESKASLRASRDDLAQENTALAAQNAALVAKVSDLTNLLGTRTEPEKGIVASVIARPPVAPYDVLIIDQGEDAGVKSGAQVEGLGGTPIGTVGEADATQSRVALFSTRNIRTAGWAGQGRIPVTLTGAGAGAFTTSVSKDAGVIVGDAVYVAGNGAFPVGTVVKIESDPSSPDVSLDVRPYTNPFSLTWVVIAR